MKKFLLLFISSILFISGCSGLSASVPANPYEVKAGSKVLSLYDDAKETFEENRFEIYESTEDPFYITYDVDYTDWNNYILYRNREDINKIGCIYLFDNSVLTYKSISIGDDLNKLKKTFDKLYIQEDDDCETSDVYGYLRFCAAFFNSKGEEVSSLNELDENEKGTYIIYLTDENDIIVNILLRDMKSAKACL